MSELSAHSESLAHEHWAACRIPRAPKHVLPGIDPARPNLQISYLLHSPSLSATYRLSKAINYSPRFVLKRKGQDGGEQPRGEIHLQESDTVFRRYRDCWHSVEMILGWRS